MMQIALNVDEVRFYEFMQGGEPPEGKEEWIIIKAQIELATIQAFELSECHLVGVYKKTELPAHPETAGIRYGPVFRH